MLHAGDSVHTIIKTIDDSETPTCRITGYTLLQDHPGAQEMIEDSSIDLATGAETATTITLNTFASDGTLAQQDIFDDNGSMQGSNNFAQSWSLWDFFWNAITTLQDNLSFHSYAKEDINNAAEELFGESFLLFAGYDPDPGQTGVFGKGERNDKVRISAINGILNWHTHCLDSMELLSRTHGDTNIHYVYYPTYGWTWDIVKGIVLKCGYVSPEASQLAHTWKKLIDEMGGTKNGGLIIHYAHSMGAINTLLAKKFMTPEELRMIRVITIASPVMLPNEDFESVTNYVSKKDGVPLLDPIGHYFYDNIVYVESMSSIPLIDHFLSTETYQRLVAYLGKQFTDTYGIRSPNGQN